MRKRTERVFIRVTPEERKILQRKASAAGLSVSDYVRLSLIHSDDCTINVIDIEPLRKVMFELAKQGVNLNQFMHFLNTYKQDGFDAGRAETVLEKERKLFADVREAIIALRKEAERHHVHLIEPEKME